MLRAVVHSSKSYERTSKENGDPESRTQLAGRTIRSRDASLAHQCGVGGEALDPRIFGQFENRFLVGPSANIFTLNVETRSACKDSRLSFFELFERSRGASRKERTTQVGRIRTAFRGSRNPTKTAWTTGTLPASTSRQRSPTT